MGASRRQQWQKLPEKLRLIRLSTRYTQKELCKTLCELLDNDNIISQSNISYYESGKRPVPLLVAGAYVKFANSRTSSEITCDDLSDESQTIFEAF